MPLVDGRCSLTELPPDQCGCKEHRNSEAVNLEGVKIRARIEASRDGVCALNPDHAIISGDPIGMATEERSTSQSIVVGHAIGWVCARCVREIGSQS